MDFNEIKNFIPSNGEKVIIVENGKPVMVLLSFEDYKRLSKKNPKIEQKSLKIEDKEIENKETINKELTLEDLPF